MAGAHPPSELPSERLRLHKEATGDSLVPLKEAQHNRLHHITERMMVDPEQFQVIWHDLVSALGHNDPNRVRQFLLDEDH